jgi:NAD(P)-dependent dehydrogenase (short-subunit alcohol dehydrogenase family)
VSSALDGKTCVVTGAGRGIGKMIAVDLAAQGASLVLCSRTSAEIEATARQIREAHGAHVRTNALDVSDPDAVAAFARSCADAGPVFGLVNCAGVLGPVGRIDTVDLNDWLDAIANNIGGTAATCSAFAAGMIAAGEGSIVNFSGAGVGGPNPPGRMSSYTASKAAIVALTEVLGVELAPHGVRVNAIAPGAIATSFMRPVLDGGREVAGDALYDQIAQGQGNPAPIDPTLRLIRFLLAPESAHVSGRFLSARWDDPANLDVEAVSGSRLTLRRIDGALFEEVDRAST